MLYFTQEIQTDGKMKRTAGVKARDDVDSILTANGWKAIQVEDSRKDGGKSAFAHISGHINAYREWANELKKLTASDTLLIQFPILNHSIFLRKVISSLKKKGVFIILLIHDLEILRKAVSGNTSTLGKIRLNAEEKSILMLADRIIAHNKNMMSFLTKMGVDCNKQVNLELFDYLLPSQIKANDTLSVDKPLIIAGNLSRNKASYIYTLPESCKFNLYGVGYEAEDKPNIRYFGSFLPDELPKALTGSFGLIWDGDSDKTCSGAYGAYLRINNPHKTSLYLACGIPVVIWKEAALSQFVKQHNCGILVNSLDECAEILSNISHEEYEEIRQNAIKVSEHLRNGYYTLTAIKHCQQKMDK